MISIFAILLIHFLEVFEGLNLHKSISLRACFLAALSEVRYLAYRPTSLTDIFNFTIILNRQLECQTKNSFLKKFADDDRKT